MVISLLQDRSCPCHRWAATLEHALKEVNMQTNKLYGYLLITLFLYMGGANAAEKARCFVELDPETLTTITGKTSKSGNLWFWWEVKDQTYTRSKTRILTSSLSNNQNDAVSTTNYTISGEKIVKSSGDNNASYDSLGHIKDFSGIANGGIQYIIDLNVDNNDLSFSFDNNLFKNAICEVVYDGDSLHQTIYFPSQKQWDNFMKANGLQSTAD